MLSGLLEELRQTFSNKAAAVLVSLLAVCLILIFGLLLSYLAKRWLRAILDHSRIRDDLLLKNFFIRSVTFSIFTITLLTALAQMGVDVRTFIAGLGVTGLIIGFALRDTLSNFAAGLLLLVYRPFRAGELIEVEGSQGIVDEMTIVNMQMTTTDGIRVILPNSKVWGAKITNYSQSQKRRTDLVVSVREWDLEPAITTITEAIKKNPKVLATPEPTIKVLSLKNDSASIEISAWTLPQDFQSFGANAYRELATALREDEIPVL